jgi:hypothetical protein
MKAARGKGKTGMVITKCWQRGFKEPNYWNESLESIQDIEVLASSIIKNTNQKTTEVMDIKKFLDGG